MLESLKQFEISKESLVTVFGGMSVTVVNEDDLDTGGDGGSGSGDGNGRCD